MTPLSVPCRLLPWKRLSVSRNRFFVLLDTTGKPVHLSPEDARTLGERLILMAEQVEKARMSLPLPYGEARRA